MYPSAVKFDTMIQSALALAEEKEIDVLALLMNQTENINHRFRRTVKFWEEEFQPLSVMPARVPSPNGAWMLGIEAEEALPEKMLIMRAQGFWWPASAKPPSHALLDLNRFDKCRRQIWGIQSSLSKNLLYFVNAACPLALANDYRGIGDGPNASLVLTLLILHWSVWLCANFIHCVTVLIFIFLTPYRFRMDATSASKQIAPSKRERASWWTTTLNSGRMRRMTKATYPRCVHCT